MILAFSEAAVHGYELEEPYRTLVLTEPVDFSTPWEMDDGFAEPKPITLYGVTKPFGEDLDRYYALTSDLSVYR